ncbi:Sulfhydrogenase 1 subunit alpha [uncultured archaeon]|nr:Sulfhydrogenase 1 subunit alpha [uncultured archaeon]
MHESDFDLHIEGISKIEGHAGLDIQVRRGQVTDVRLAITEYKRFYDQAMRGKMYHSIPNMVSHICGTCSIAHQVAAIEAIEHAVGAQPSEQTLLLRKLSLWGLNLRDHAMHLYLFCLPDLLGVDSVLDLGPEYKELMKTAFDVKKAGNHLCTETIGAAVHPTRAQVGRYSQVPDAAKTKELVHELLEMRPHVIELIDRFSDCHFKFDTPTRYVAVRSPDFCYLGDTIWDSEERQIPQAEYFDHLKRVIIPYSQATGFHYQGSPYMVGALARMNLHRDTLHPDTRRDAAAALKRFPSHNRYDSNVAQAIEMLNAIDHATDAFESHEFKKEETPLPPAREGRGVGVIEAPRGTLYYMVDVMADGKVREGIPVIPTAQNQVHMEIDIGELVQNSLDLPKEQIEHEIEKLVRAYDPCTSCAAHFLKVKWDVKGAAAKKKKTGGRKKVASKKKKARKN